MSNTSNSNNYKTLIVGKWLLTTENDKIYVASNNTLTKDTTSTYPFADGFNLVYVFDTSGDFYVEDGLTNPEINLTSNYSVTNSAMLYTEKGDDTTYTDPILKLNSTTLELQSTFEATGDSSTPGLSPDITYKFVSTQYFTKQ